MATATLVSQEIEEGQRLIDALNEAKLSIDSALWIYSSESETWRLMLTSPTCDIAGSLQAYKEILPIYHQVKPDLKIDWTALVAVSPKNEFIEGLRQLQLNWNIDLRGKRLVNNVVKDFLIEDGYVYQIK
jgi:hypothetical protein